MVYLEKLFDLYVPLHEETESSKQAIRKVPAHSFLKKCQIVHRAQKNLYNLEKEEIK